MNNLTKRIITATILLLVIIFVLLQESAQLTSCFIGLILTFCFYEFVKMLKLQNKKQSVLMFFAFVIAPIIFAVTGRTFAFYSIFGFIYVLTVGFFFYEPNNEVLKAEFEGRELEAVQKKTFLYLLYFILIGLGGFSLTKIACHSESAKVFFWLISVVSFNDIFAYAGGRLIGGAKFNKFISPNKTISGSVCGMIGAIIVSYLMIHFLGISNLRYGLFVPTIFTVWCAQIGDLIESFIKRIVGVKDSSNLLPGHGGVLDRVDAIFGAAPLTLICFF